MEGVIRKRKEQRRIRTAFTTDQLYTLEKIFSISKYIDKVKKCEIANIMDISPKSIKVWFQNRRMKEKRKLSERSDSSEPSGVQSSSSPVAQSDRRKTIQQSPSSSEYCDTTTENHLSRPPQAPVSTQSYSVYQHNNLDPSYLRTNFSDDNDAQNVSNVTPSDNYSGFYNDNNIYPTNYYPNATSQPFAQSVQDNGNSSSQLITYWTSDYNSYL